MITVEVTSEPIDAAAALARLAGADAGAGAVASFLGQVRGGDGVEALELQHYPGATEAALSRIAEAAQARWGLSRALILHRVGRMAVGAPIVFTAAAAPHRRAALEAVAFLIDVLKTEAPFWKKEVTAAGARWVEARAEDNAAAARWLGGAAAVAEKEPSHVG